MFKDLYINEYPLTYYRNQQANTIYNYTNKYLNKNKDYIRVNYDKAPMFKILYKNIEHFEAYLILTHLHFIDDRFTRSRFAILSPSSLVK